MGENRKLFRYFGNENRQENIIANDGDSFSNEVFDEIRARIASLNSLPSSLSLQVYPFGYVESETEVLLRTYFKKDHYLLVAALLDKNLEILSFLLVDKSSKKNALVVSYSRLEALVSTHNGALIEEIPGENMDLGVFLDSLSGDLSLGPEAPSSSKNKKVPNLGFVKESLPEEEEEEFVAPILPPSFSPNSKKTIRDLGSGKAKKKAGEKIPEMKEVPVPEPKEEEEVEVQFEVSRPSFEANKKGKIREIRDEPVKKKVTQKPAPKPSSSPIKEPPKKIVTPPPSIEKPVFAPSKQKKPTDLKNFEPDWRAKDVVFFGPSNAKRGSILLLNGGRKSSSGGFDFERELLRLEKEPSPNLLPNCIFAPSILDYEDSRLERIRRFKAEEWNLLAVYLDAFGKPYCYLLSLKENPLFSFVLLGPTNLKVPIVSTKGVYIVEKKLAFRDLLSLFAARAEEEPVKEKPLPKKIEPLPAPKPLPKAPPLEQKEEKPQKEKLVERRRVFLTDHFKRQMQKFLSFHPVDGQRDYEELLKFLLSSSEEEIERMQLRSETKKILEDLPLPVYKFPFSKSGDYSASRVFYVRGHQLLSLKRKMEENDFVLIAFSSQQEHERQGKIARDGLNYLLKDAFLTRQLLSNADEEELDEIAYLSAEQWAALNNGKAALPAAFVGTAGSGKTLMSYQAYCDMAGEQAKVLYLTYQKALANEASKKLLEMNLPEVEALTYRQLIETLFGKEEASRMRTKDRYRNWFFDKLERLYDKEFAKNAALISPSKEDAFLISYVFYRGVIEGTMEGYEARSGGILSEAEFLRKVKNEEGFSLEQKKAIYAIALRYEKHLVDHNGLTDNKFALRLLLRKPLHIYDAIIVDEYQDLSELQLLAITTLLKEEVPHRLYLFGDDNQAVNPTILNISSVGSVIRKAFEKYNKLNTYSLLSTYRSGPNLLAYINDILELKNQVIGKDKKENELAHVSYREDESDTFVTLIEDPSLFEYALSSAKTKNADTAFLFPSAYSRDEAKKRYASYGKDFLSSFFLSVEESKGREWDSAVLVGFFGENKELFEGMLGEKKIGKHSTVHRMMFNRYYVALTRAKNHVLIYEKDLKDAPLIRSKILASLTSLKKKEELENLFGGSLAPEHWIKQGDKLFKKEDYEGAIRSYLRGKEDPSSLEKLLKAEDYKKIFSSELNAKESIDALIGYQDYKALLSYYHESGEGVRENLLTLFLNGTDLKEKKEAFKECFEDLFESERIYYFHLLSKDYESSIRKSLKRLEYRKEK